MKETEILRGLHKAKCYAKGTSFVKGKKGVNKVDAKLTRGEAVLPVKTVKAVGATNIARLIADTNGRGPKTSLRDGGKYAIGFVEGAKNLAGSIADGASSLFDSAKARLTPSPEGYKGLDNTRSANPVYEDLNKVKPQGTVYPVNPSVVDATRMGPKPAPVGPITPAQDLFGPQQPYTKPTLEPVRGVPGQGAAAGIAEAAKPGLYQAGQGVGQIVRGAGEQLGKAVKGAGTKAIVPAYESYRALAGDEGHGGIYADSSVPFADKLGQAARDVVHIAVPSVGAVVGGTFGAGVGSVAGPVGTFAGGAAAGAYGMNLGERGASAIADRESEVTKAWRAKKLEDAKQSAPAAVPSAQPAAPTPTGNVFDPSRTLSSSQFDPQGQPTGQPGIMQRGADLRGLQAAREASFGEPRGKLPPQWVRGETRLPIGEMTGAELKSAHAQASAAGDLGAMIALKREQGHTNKMEELSVGRNIERARLNNELRNQQRERNLKQLQSLHMDYSTDKQGNKTPVMNGENYAKAYDRLSATLAEAGVDIADMSPKMVDQFAVMHKGASTADDWNKSTKGKFLAFLQGEHPQTSRDATDYSASERNKGAVFNDTRRGVAGRIPDAVDRGGVWELSSATRRRADDDEIAASAEEAARRARIKFTRTN